MRVFPVRMDYPNLLVNKYLHNFHKVAHLFEHDPGDTASFPARFEIIGRDYHTDRDELVRILTAYNERLGCGDRTRQNLVKMTDPGTAVVITGQQAGVLTGPLYTIYKSVTAIQLAGDITRKTGINTVPVFWVDAEDHDYAEIDHLDVINREQQIIRLKLDYTPRGHYSIGHVPVTEAVFRLIEHLEKHTNPSEWKGAVINKVRQLAENSGNLADWFAAIMTWLFQSHGLIMVNPLDKDLRRLLSGTFDAFLRKTDRVNKKLQAGTEKVRAFGVRPQVETAGNNVHLFLYVDGERLPLLKSGDTYAVRGRKRKWTLKDLTDMARNSPELLSPNVVLRPVAQDVLLPILAYIAGPGEISYYALYREIYPLFNQRMPIIYPRVNLTVIERGIAKNMDKYGLSFIEGEDGLGRKLEQYLAERDSLGIDGLFSGYAGELRKSFKELIAKVAVIDSELSHHGAESLNRMLHQVERLRKKAGQYHRKSCDTAIKRFQNIENNIYPRHNLQERVLNIFPYLFKYGPGYIDRLAGLPLLGDNDHKLLYMGG